VKVVGLGSVLGELKNQIQKIRREVKEIDDSFTPIPGMIESTNIIRENESLRLANNKKIELIAAYEYYTRQIENLISSAFEIQKDLKDILKDQAKLLNSKKSRGTKSVKINTSKKKSKRRLKRK
jgi:prefoldin subunit 5